MAFSITEFKGNFAAFGARNTLFQVEITNFGGLTAAGISGKLAFTCKSASIPPSDLGNISIPYMGRKIQTAGDRVFPDWTVNVMNDEDFRVRDAMEAWMGKINGHESNILKYPGLASGLNTYKVDATVRQYAKDGRTLRQYRFIGLYPGVVGEIALSWDANDQIEEFPVTFKYDYWLIDAVGDSEKQAAIDIL